MQIGKAFLFFDREADVPILDLFSKPRAAEKYSTIGNHDLEERIGMIVHLR